MVDEKDQILAKEVRGGDTLISRWAKEPETSTQKDDFQEPQPKSKPKPSKSPAKEMPTQHDRDQTGSNTRLESKWATVASAPTPRHDRTQPTRQGNGNWQNKSREPINTHTAGSQSQDKWHHSSKPRSDQHKAQHSKHQQHGYQGHSHHQSQNEHNNPPHSQNYSRSQYPLQQQQQQQQQSYENKPRNHQPQQGNKLAEHLGLSASPEKAKSRRTRSKKSHAAADATSPTATPVEAPSSWSLDGYEPGEDWAAAEEEAFTISK